MEIRGINRTALADNADRGNREKDMQSRALTVAGEPSGRADRSASFANPNRRSSAFLAHLTLQYADKDTQNRLITERREHAIAAYASGPRSNTASHPRTRSGVKA